MNKIWYTHWKTGEKIERSLSTVLAGVGKGWHPLVTELITDLFKIGWDGNLLQVKEKFGGLRFYIGPVGGGDLLYEDIYKRINRAEQESFETCEVCGEPGRIRNKDWMLTLCDKHAQEMGKDDV